MELKNFHLEFAPTKIEVASSGDLAYEMGTYSLAYQGDDEQLHDNGKYVVVWKKADGNWKAAADIFNTDQ
jgi:ketosteroid isomerase-like protein